MSRNIKLAMSAALVLLTHAATANEGDILRAGYRYGTMYVSVAGLLDMSLLVNSCQIVPGLTLSADPFNGGCSLRLSGLKLRGSVKISTTVLIAAGIVYLAYKGSEIMQQSKDSAKADQEAETVENSDLATESTEDSEQAS